MYSAFEGIQEKELDTYTETKKMKRERAKATK